MFDEKAKVSSYDEYDEEPVIVLPIPYEDEAAEEARQRALEEQAKKERIENLKINAPAVVPTGYSVDDSAELLRKKEEADRAKAAYEAALAKLKEAH